MLVVGQVLIGIGCAPAFLVCTVFIARHFPSERFAAVSGLTLGLGGIGMLLTGTPLAWLIEATSWPMGFAVLGGLAALAWLLIWRLVHEPAPAAPDSAVTLPRESLRQAFQFFIPHAECKGVLRPRAAPVIDPGRADAGVAQPILPLGDVGLVLQGAGGGRRP